MKKAKISLRVIVLICERIGNTGTHAHRKAEHVQDKK